MLGAIESLLCARVADQLSDTPKHDPNQELMAQGVANFVVPFFGGMPATGTIARTVTNIRSGAASPVAGIVHAATLAAVVLLAAPLSGHFATLLRETVRTLLQDHEVYITDWHNARDVSLRHGAFGLEDYIEYMIRFVEAVGEEAHVVAVCQPCVAALAATAVMAEDDHPATPRSLTLMAGPVDCRVNPTGVNQLATSKPIEWFEQNLISHVPLPHKGVMRRVYPGFVQLSAFMSMNLERHQQSFRHLYEHLVEGRTEEARTIQTFYDEYLAVNDLPAEFYLETVEKVFQTYDLPRGVLQYRGRTVNTKAIRRTALFTVEGERDDICAVGQTVAAQDLCTSVRPY
jgi:poly(3-hydroxybutyrate) depolymerase